MLQEKLSVAPNVSEQSPLLKTSFGRHHSTYSANVRRDIESDVEQVPNLDGRGRRRRRVQNTSTTEIVTVPKSSKVTGEDFLNQDVESLDYDTCENSIYRLQEHVCRPREITKRNLSRWVVCLLIGIVTGLIAVFVDVMVKLLAGIKYKSISFLVDKCTQEHCQVYGLLTWIGFNMLYVGFATLLVVFVAPEAIGSGVAQVKAFLNGVKVSRIMSLKTLLVKVVGVTFSVAGGLTVGKEGPMIHAGCMVAAGVSQGRASSFRFDLGLFEYFRDDTEKRDFISAGAAAGVAAAFGAPIGGVLFALEEGASFWNQALTWRIFFCSMISSFTLAVALGIYRGTPGNLSDPGLINFGAFGADDLNYSVLELPIYAAMGVLGGVLGALFNKSNHMINHFRSRYVNRTSLRILEALLVCSITALSGFTMMYFVNDCRPLGNDDMAYPLQFFCPDGQYNSMAALFFQTPEEGVRSLFHDQRGTYHWSTLLIFCIPYFLLFTWTCGVSVPSGLFIPNLFIGAAWGRLIAIFISLIPGCENLDWMNPGKFAIIGAAAQLGGVVRMTISLTVMLIEATQNIIFGLPIMIVLLVAKFVGDFFSDGIYDMHIAVNSIPILKWEPPNLGHSIFATSVMAHPVVCFNCVESVQRLVDVLKHEVHNGFPIVEHSRSDGSTFGTFKGLILRSQILCLLKNKIFENDYRHSISLSDFRQVYPRQFNIMEIDCDLSSEERELIIDLTPFMNPAPYLVLQTTSLVRIFRLFRGLGLRHLVVINHANQVVGMVTRKDLARYRLLKYGDSFRVAELEFTTTVDSASVGRLN